MKRVSLKGATKAQLRQLVIDHAKLVEAFYRSWSGDKPILVPGLARVVRALRRVEKA